MLGACYVRVAIWTVVWVSVCPLCSMLNCTTPVCNDGDYPGTAVGHSVAVPVLPDANVAVEWIQWLRGTTMLDVIELTFFDLYL